MLCSCGAIKSPADIAPLIWGYKLARELARRMPTYRGEYAPEHPLFPAGSEAISVEAERGVDMDAPDIMYSEEDHVVIERFIRENGALLFILFSSWNEWFPFSLVQTTWHSVSVLSYR